LTSVKNERICTLIDHPVSSPLDVRLNILCTFWQDEVDTHGVYRNGKQVAFGTCPDEVQEKGFGHCNWPHKGVRSYDNLITRDYGFDMKRLKPESYGMGYREDDSSPSGWVNRIDLDLFVMNNVGATPAKRVLALDSDEGVSAITAVNGVKVTLNPDDVSSRPQDMVDVLVPWLERKCPSGGQRYNPSAAERSQLKPFLSRGDASGSSPLDTYLALASSLRGDGGLESTFDAIQGMLKRDHTLIFYKAGDNTTTGTAIQSRLERVLWASLSEIQQSYASALGYDQASWDHPEAPKGPLPGGLTITFNNCLKPSGTYLFVQMTALIVLGILILSEVRHFFVLLQLVSSCGCHAILLYSVAFFAYCIIPVVVMMASILVIFEAGDELDVMKVTSLKA
jgi:hypothetical protein